jgi:hypothetical protein
VPFYRAKGRASTINIIYLWDKGNGLRWAVSIQIQYQVMEIIQSAVGLAPSGNILRTDALLIDRWRKGRSCRVAYRLTASHRIARYRMRAAEAAVSV